MLRRRETAVVVAEGAETPVELLDPEHEVWVEHRSTVRWLESHGLVRRMRANDDLKGLTPLERHWEAAQRWIVAQGHFKTLQPDGYRWPDVAAMRAAGIPLTNSRRMHEKLARYIRD